MSYDCKQKKLGRKWHHVDILMYTSTKTIADEKLVIDLITNSMPTFAIRPLTKIDQTDETCSLFRLKTQLIKKSD